MIDERNLFLVLFGSVSFTVHMCNRHSWLPFLHPFPTQSLSTGTGWCSATISQGWRPYSQLKDILWVVRESKVISLALPVWGWVVIQVSPRKWEAGLPGASGELGSLLRRHQKMVVLLWHLCCCSRLVTMREISLKVTSKLRLSEGRALSERRTCIAGDFF